MGAKERWEDGGWKVWVVGGEGVGAWRGHAISQPHTDQARPVDTERPVSLFVCLFLHAYACGRPHDAAKNAARPPSSTSLWTSSRLSSGQCKTKIIMTI